MKPKIIFLAIIIIPTLCLSFIRIFNNAQKHSWAYVINSQIKAYPNMEPEDIYKIIYQGVLGPNHLGTNRNSIFNYLKNECRDLYPEGHFNLVERISPDDKYVRINLKKYKFENGDIALLSEIVYQSCEEGDLEDLKQALREVDHAIIKNKIDYPAIKWQQYYQVIKKRNYFVPHHSSFFNDFYSPSYRVVSKKIWDEKTRGVFD